MEKTTLNEGIKFARVQRLYIAGTRDGRFNLPSIKLPALEIIICSNKAIWCRRHVLMYFDGDDYV